MGPPPLHGDAGALGSTAGRIGRHPGVRHRCPDRQFAGARSLREASAPASDDASAASTDRRRAS